MSQYPYTWNDKTIIWDNGHYFIASGNDEHSYLTLWTADNKPAGSLKLERVRHTHRNTGALEWRAQIRSVQIDSKHRGYGMGRQLYQTALAWLPDGIAGLYSYLPDRSNRKQIPRIYQRLNGYILDGDHAYIDRPLDVVR